MAIRYTPIGWVTDLTALSASNFNHMEEGIVNSVNAVNNILEGDITFLGRKTFESGIKSIEFSAQEGFSAGEERGTSYGANYILKYNYGNSFLEAYFNLPDKPNGEYELTTKDYVDSKVQNLPSPVYVTTSEKPEGLTYGLRIQNNGWTSEIQQEGGAKIELTGTSVKVNTPIELGPGMSIKNHDPSVNDYIDLIQGNSRIMAIGSTVYTYANFLPGASGTMNLGSDTMRWNTVYANQFNLGTDTANLYIAADDSDRIGLYHMGNERIKIGTENSTYCVAHWTPDRDNTYSLGTTTMRWKDLNTSGVINAKSSLVLRGSPDINVILGSDGAISPAGNNRYNIGSASKTWKNLHLGGTQYFYSSTNNGEDWNIKNTNGTLYYERTNLSYSLAIGGTSVSTINLVPKSNNSYNLGGDSAQWKDGWINNLKGVITMTQAQYDALATKDADTLYFIEEE